VGTTHAEYAVLAERLCTQLAIMSQVRVVRQRLASNGFPRPGAVARSPLPRVSSFGAVGIVASTGGPNALAELLGGWPPDFPLPVLLVQHLTASFLEGFVSWLGSVCPFAVQIAREGEVPLPGRVYLAPPDRHLQITGGALRVSAAAPVCFQRPSGTLLFQSMAHSLGSRALGVLLTGMGEDGAEGLLEIRQVGGHTIAEDESTAVVYGMPGAAVQRGAACESLPLPAIGPRVLELLAQSQEA
jgi:two-component system chemotaxis response regulator CheB